MDERRTGSNNSTHDSSPQEQPKESNNPAALDHNRLDINNVAPSTTKRPSPEPDKPQAYPNVLENNNVAPFSMKRPSPEPELNEEPPSKKTKSPSGTSRDGADSNGSEQRRQSPPKDAPDQEDLQQRTLDAETARRHRLKKQAIIEIRWLLALNSKLKREKDALRADLEKEKTGLAEELQREKEAGKEEREAALQQTREFERWRGQTVPPVVIPKTQFLSPPPKRKEISPSFKAANPKWFDPEAEAALGPRKPLVGPTDEQMAHLKELARPAEEQRAKTYKAREGIEAVYVAAQKNFEAGKHDEVSLDKPLHDFKEKEWAMFTKGPMGKVRRAAVYAAQLRRENTSVHILPFPAGELIGRKEYAEYAKQCLTAQLPELQAEAAKACLSEEDYTKFMVRSFGDQWQDYDLANKKVDPEKWQQTVEALLEDERFKTACRLWAAGEPAINEDRCWPPTFNSLEKTQACTQFKNEEERMQTLMKNFPGWKKDDDPESA